MSQHIFLDRIMEEFSIINHKFTIYKPAQTNIVVTLIKIQANSICYTLYLSPNLLFKKKGDPKFHKFHLIFEPKNGTANFCIHF